MRILGHEVAPEILAAGEAAMQGTFRKIDVEAALIRAGCPRTIRIKYTEYFADRVADNLIQRAKRAGRIAKGERRTWVEVTK